MKIKILLFAIVNCFFFTQAQYIVNDVGELSDLKKLPLEKAYIDHTGPLLFSGEYLYYALHCFNAQSNKVSNISQIAYVALVNESKEYLFEHKIKLKAGKGFGDFFVSTQIPSGKYKLLGYTQWMKNAGLSQIFKDDIIIVNPYLADQSALLVESKKSKNSDNPTNLSSGVRDTATISISTDKINYSPRQKVELSIRNFKGVLGHGTYTIKVKRKEELPVSNALDAVSYATSYFNADKQIEKKLGDSIFLPEQRGELFYGTVKNNSTGEPVADVPVIISIPGEEFILKSAQTDQSGNFYSYLRKDYKSPIAVVQIEGTDDSYSIVKGVIPNLKLDSLTFSNFKLEDEFADYIKNRSVLNQIENQFFMVRPDSILEGNPIDPFDGGIPEIFVLDDYTRFPTFEETMVEVIKFTGYRKNVVGNDYIRVAQDFKSYNEQYNDYPAIILIDGVFIPNHEDIRKFDARKIEKISLTRNQFRLGNKNYQGIISVKTFDGDYLSGYVAKNSLQVSLNQPVPRKNYFVQTYKTDESKFSHIPDYRRLLFWKPSITIDASSYSFEFFTSDLEGEYEIILNGFTYYGKPLTVVKKINVVADGLN